MRCVDCHRFLTDAKSVERGVGPVCWRKRQIAEMLARQLCFRFDYEQQQERPQEAV